MDCSAGLIIHHHINKSQTDKQGMPPRRYTNAGSMLCQRVGRRAVAAKHNVNISEIVCVLCVDSLRITRFLKATKRAVNNIYKSRDIQITPKSTGVICIILIHTDTVDKITAEVVQR